MHGPLRNAVQKALGATVTGVQSIGGGDINNAYGVVLSSGDSVFVKANDGAAPQMFEAEAAGLAWLRETHTLRVPEVLYATPSTAPPPHFLALEMLSAGRRRSDFDVELGRGLAALHRCAAPAFGLDHNNFIGRLPQDNRPCNTWTEFYASRRIEAQLRMAERAGLASRTMRRGIEGLLARLDTLVGPPEPPARLHGDLWGGNLHCDSVGAPCLIDPAVYGGHREMDLAMMRLFGGFAERCFAAYAEAYPLAAGHHERIPLYQLYPLLVHVNLFGAGYVAAVERIIRPYV